MTLTFFGSRGSIPFASASRSRYGGNTSCLRLDAGGRELIIDAGSGLLGLEPELRNAPHPPDILLSHLHLDHIVGLTAFKPVWSIDGGTRIFTLSRNDTPLAAQIFGAFKPPYWPVDMTAAARAQCIAIQEDQPFSPGGTLTVTPFEAAHPDRTTAFHITDGGKTLVYLLDHEVQAFASADKAARTEKINAYCKNADVIVFDATYRVTDYAARHGWGHSTVEDGVRLAESCGCKRMIFTHFSQEYDDAALDGLLSGVWNADNRYVLAYDGLEMVI